MDFTTYTVADSAQMISDERAKALMSNGGVEGHHRFGSSRNCSRLSDQPVAGHRHVVARTVPHEGNEAACLKHDL